MENVYRLITAIQDDCARIMSTAAAVDFEGCAVLEAILRIQDSAKLAEQSYREDA